jgi:hypothetical protein
MGFLRVLFLFLLIYFFIRLIGRFIIGLSRPHNSGSREYDDINGKPGREGDISIKYRPENRKKIIQDSDGEYVKFEETDDRE